MQQNNHATLLDPGESESLDANEQADLLDLTDDAIIVHDLEGTIRYWNRGACEMYGFSKEDSIGSNIQTLLKTEFPQSVESINQDMAINHRWEGQLVQFSKDKRRLLITSRWVEVAKNGVTPTIMLTNNEVSAKKQADQLLSTAVEQADVLRLAAEQQADALLQTAQQQAQVLLSTAQQVRSDHRPIQDATELKRLLAQKEQAEILDLTHDAIIVRDLVGTIAYWNRGAQELYGYTKEEAVGRNYKELLKYEFPQPLQEIEAELAENSRWEGELVQVTQDNQKIFVASRWVLKSDSQKRPFSVLEINSDTTVQKQASEMLLTAQRQAGDVLSKAQKQAQVVLLAAQQSRSEQCLHLVVEAASNGIIMVNENGIITLVNSQVESLFGYGREELLGHTIETLAPSAELMKMKNDSLSTIADKNCTDDKNSINDKNSATQSNAQSAENLNVLSIPGPASFFVNPQATKMSKGDFWGQRKDGVLIPVEIGLNPLVIEGARFVLASIADITERNRYEELLKGKINELARSNEELEQFAYVCSHDLQEPLRVISNFTHLLSKRYRGQLDEKADRFMDFTVDASKRMQVLINDLLIFSRLKSKAQVFKKINSAAVIKMALANLKVVIDETDATINYDEMPTVFADTSQLLQLFQNLVGNALKFRSKAPPIISITARRDGNFWLYSVTDNGIGLDMQFADRIFVIFQRLHYKEEYEGSGIGLAVCRKIVQRHGGRIWTESVPGSGTTFYFTIADKEDG